MDVVSNEEDAGKVSTADCETSVTADVSMIVGEERGGDSNDGAHTEPLSSTEIGDEGEGEGKGEEGDRNDNDDENDDEETEEEELPSLAKERARRPRAGTKKPAGDEAAGAKEGSAENLDIDGDGAQGMEGKARKSSANRKRKGTDAAENGEGGTDKKKCASRKKTTSEANELGTTKSPSKKSSTAAAAATEATSHSILDSSASSTKNRLYCLCRKPYNKNDDMMGCDTCDEWYHFACLGISAEDIPEGQWSCPPCVERLSSEALGKGKKPAPKKSKSRSKSSLTAAAAAKVEANAVRAFSDASGFSGSSLLSTDDGEHASSESKAEGDDKAKKRKGASRKSKGDEEAKGLFDKDDKDDKKRADTGNGGATGSGAGGSGSEALFLDDMMKYDTMDKQIASELYDPNKYFKIEKGMALCTRCGEEFDARKMKDNLCTAHDYEHLDMLSKNVQNDVSTWKLLCCGQTFESWSADSSGDPEGVGFPKICPRVKQHAF